jgi:2-deoxy-D-gluconate 3-dehydrogenase
VAIVTGAALGIGRRTAQRLGEAGAAVVLVDRDEDALAAAQQALSADGVRATTVVADVADARAGDAVVEHCRRELGEVDVLVNNAGIYPMIPLADLDDTALRNVLDVNLIGTIHMARAVALSMIGRGAGGAIVNIASIDGVTPSAPGFVAYCASKGGVVTATRSLAVELAPHGIRVNSISPGTVFTEGVQRGLAVVPEEQQPAALQMLASRVPLGRLAQPDDIATVAVFLASDASSFVTGANLLVDGGQRTGPA